jgi:magnesium transporter
MSKPRTAARKAGLAPGTPVYVGAEAVAPSRLEWFRYSGDTFSEHAAAARNEFPEGPPADGVLWLNLDGVHDVERVSEIGRRFGLHPLTLEDIVNTHQRAKIETYNADYLYLVLRMVWCRPGDHAIQSEQLSLVVGPHTVLSFQERPGDVFDPLRDRLRHNRGDLRTLPADHLAYSLMDAVVDGYFVVLDEIGERVTELEARMVAAPTPESLHTLHALRRQLLDLRHAVWPLREVAAALERPDSSPLISAATRPYLRDLYDHTVRVLEAVESLRERLSSLLDLYLSATSNRMNEVMKVLTLIATLFMPLTLVVGIYGMNFDAMPELRWRWGYPAVLILMLAVTLGMLGWFRRRKWL